MTKLTKLLLLCAALLGVLGGGMFLYDRFAGELEPQNIVAQGPAPAPEADGQEETPPVEKALAPDFTVYDGQGNEVHLSDFRGKPVVLNFWASWCGPCRSEMPDFEAAFQNLGDEVHFLMVNATGGQETVESAQEFIDQTGYTFPVYFDTDYSAAMAYGVSALPMTFFIDAEGYPVAYAQGAMSAQTLQTGIDMVYPQQ